MTGPHIEIIKHSILSTLDEIISHELEFKAHTGCDVSNQEDWLQLAGIISRMETKLLISLGDMSEESEEQPPK